MRACRETGEQQPKQVFAGCVAGRGKHTKRTKRGTRGEGRRERKPIDPCLMSDIQ